MTFQDWALRLGVTHEAVEACLVQPSEDDARQMLDELKADAKRRYRAFARALHPDLGGDGEALKSLNQAWSVIEGLVIHSAVDSSPVDPRAETVPAEPVEAPRITVIGNWIKIG